jgi:hypothetical protein
MRNAPEPNSFVLVLLIGLLALSSMTVLASPGWTPQGITESHVSIRAHALSGNNTTANETLTDMQWANLTLSIVFGFGLIVLSVVDKRHSIWPTFAGLIWLCIGVVGLYQFGLLWMITSIGIGLIMWIEGALERATSKGQGT